MRFLYCHGENQNYIKLAIRINIFHSIFTIHTHKYIYVQVYVYVYYFWKTIIYKLYIYAIKYDRK